MANLPRLNTSKELSEQIKDRTKQFTTNQKALLRALHNSLGNITQACEAIGVDRSSYYYYIETNPDFKEAVNDINNIALDHVEQQLFKKIDGIKITGKDGQQYDIPPSDAAIIFYLKCKGKQRGYIERTEIDMAGSLSINFVEDKTYQVNPDQGQTIDIRQKD